MEYLLSEESAQKQIDLLLSTNSVDIEDIESEVLRNALKSSLNVLRKAIMKGLLEVILDDNSNLKVIQILSRNSDKKVEYKEMTGQAKIEMGKVSEDNNYEKSYTLLGYLSGLGIDGIKTFKEPDLGIAECLGSVFLGL